MSAKLDRKYRLFSGWYCTAVTMSYSRGAHHGADPATATATTTAARRTCDQDNRPVRHSTTR